METTRGISIGSRPPKVGYTANTLRKFCAEKAGVFARFTERIHELWESKELLQLDDSTQSDTTLELAKLWYSSCISNHPICAERDAQTTTSSILPKRVIDLRSAGSEPVLYEPAEGEGGKYICLSHCWGDTKPLHIVRQDDGSQSTSPRTYSLPPLATWPQTFQDAVDIARKFNIRYLWIDNTSIKQGDKEDWSTESQRMAQYFGNATFTLAATGSTNDDAGLYYPRNPLLTYPLRLLEAADVPPRNDYYVSLMGLNHIDQHEVLDAPLYSRAWVLQEQQLSRRILKFGRRGIYWECLCCSTTAANIMPGEMTPYHHQGFGGGQFLRMQIHATQSNTPANAGRNPYLDLWYATVQEFTSRNMKMKSDALPALSGLAQSYACYMNKDDQYVAGLWQSDLLLGLLWTAEVAGTRRLPIRAGLTNYDSTGFSGPSWSWISHCHRRIRLYFAEKILPGGRCNYLENTSLVGTEVTSVDIEYKPSSAPYGEVEAGRLSIKARLPSVRITTTPFKPNGNRRNMVHDSMAKTTILPLTMDRTAFDEYWLDVVIEGEKGLSLRGECDIDDMDSELWLSRVRDGEFEATFLPLIMYRGDPEGLRTAGLVLLPSENGRDEFVRVGRAQVDLPNRHIFEKSTLPIRQLTIV